MSFQELPRKPSGAVLGDAMTAALYRAGAGMSFRLLLGRELLTRLDWNENTRARLLIGAERDRGRARLQRVASGGSRLLRPARNRPASGCLVFSTQRLPVGVGRRPHSADRVAYELREDGVEFRLPPWLCEAAQA